MLDALATPSLLLALAAVALSVDAGAPPPVVDPAIALLPPTAQVPMHPTPARPARRHGKAGPHAAP
ncbi:hypothetical protein AB0I39_19460 [Kitasatospora purpeofusca]|uniref:hypothetical protein n=1 Tax=Kitasatospora purpeofusca TaxID=67352 RepID=UPI00340B1615